VPLSEDEERILTEIEQHLSASDPNLARQVGSTTVYSESLRGARWSLLGLVAGLVAAVALLQVSFWLSFFVGFALMLASAWYLDRNLRRLGRAGIQQLTTSMRMRGLRDALNNATDRARGRMNREQDE
jgi:membrane protein implicated in regulation of membrane protease activity